MEGFYCDPPNVSLQKSFPEGKNVADASGAAGSCPAGWRGSAPIAFLACVAFCWLVVRACIQSVTIDEADSFRMFAVGPTGVEWYPSSGNHLLNTLLERLSWKVFGFNQIALRLPALLGGAIYLLAAARICNKL